MSQLGLSHCSFCRRSTFQGYSKSNQVNRSRQNGIQIVCSESRIGKQPVVIPKDVTATLKGQYIKVKGKHGELEQTFADEIELTQEGDKIVLKRLEVTKKAKQLHGLSRALLNNMVTGVSQGFEKTLELVGVGYRAAVTGSKLTLSLGFSHPVEVDIPKDVKVAVNKNTQIVIQGNDKQVIGDFIAKVRAYRPPEPYKGKGIKFAGEQIRRKEGKSGKKK
eukprot:TRINITY_DN5040_c1_g1_i1.p2 TRINITY_DN5040_c1_g1~~TRINITY_DN5040_c1_g1_i1.p2  ORF type:complete len:248 (-),score=16.83 TRINITY_DN5040_c1_g1_i1:204-863(-)